MKVDTNLRIFLPIHIFCIICLIMKWTDLNWISFWGAGHHYLIPNDQTP